ncbi:histidine phosphatase family protein [Cobetia sp. 1AS1]|uniref:histidine phosphatase family protein n=1 Tax=Cobetia sp. 1AS1 TaxID=3040016 RepID=UPI00244864D0|nr:histidine phosphatase family protein [Cobetia sp. 1AS1]MDH2293660.1 histidine phosphatase family protein [Cobetia sp. 1AS1]
MTDEPTIRRVALIRHADYHQQIDTPSALQPFPLTRRGELQAREGAEEVLTLCQAHGWQPASTVHASSLLRAWQTAQVMNEVMGDRTGREFSLMAHDALWERSLGSAANLTTAQIAEAVRHDPRVDFLPADWKSNSHFRLPLPGAESLMQAGQRVADFIASLPASPSPSVSAPTSPLTSGATLTLVVGHGAALRHAAHLLGVLDFDQIAGLSMHHARPVVIEETSSGSWRHVAGEWKVRHRHEPAQD